MNSRLHHIALLSTDPERSASVLKELLGAHVVEGAKVSKGPREVLAVLPGVTLVFVKTGVKGPRSDSHVALAVSAEELKSCTAKLAEFGLEYQVPRQGGREDTLYFIDHDNNLFELNAGLAPQGDA